ncbi:FG-GAP-like repeat-containing protein [Actinomadura alba]|uniref:FG-GAP repeat protein n=1 Tax=Actinomadura alba TaxID=406431 RepID=A0ABR7LNL4_9ACTN|nr:FG-GAP-like repeat-containing protein [Actinomadura alba]MBC6466433.1 FG-GAP repeat protein [Actinomadura alba]
MRGVTAIAVLTGVMTAAPAQAAGAAKPGDFNGDGRVDLTVGAPAAAVSGADTGGVAVLNGLRPPGTLITQDTDGIPDTAESYDYFGWELASGDFDADGFADLAVGTPDEAIDGDGDGNEEVGAGSVTIVYGSPSGLVPQRSQLFTQASPGVPGDPGWNERFGNSLVTGDFNGDGRADLAVGSPNDQDGRQWSGSVTILFGGAQGLSGTDAQLLANEEDPYAYDYGMRLAAGDVDGDGTTDLAQVVRTSADARLVGYRGGGAGLDTAAPVRKDLPGFSTMFGSIAMGDLNGDGRADVAVGDPEYSSESGGKVAVLLSQGGAFADPALITQGSPGVPDTNEADDRFGWSLAMGDVDRDGRADLAVGAPGEDIDPDTAIAAGAVTVLHGSAAGVGTRQATWINQDTPGIPDEAETADLFGRTVLLADHTGDGRADLVIGVPEETIDGFTSTGLVTVLDGARTTRASAHDLRQAGVADPTFARFGSSLLR